MSYVSCLGNKLKNIHVTLNYIKIILFSVSLIILNTHIYNYVWLQLIYFIFSENV